MGACICDTVPVWVPDPRYLLTSGPGRPTLCPDKGLSGARALGTCPLEGWHQQMCLCCQVEQRVLGRLGPAEKLVDIFPWHDAVRHSCLEKVLSTQVASTSSPDLDSSARQAVSLLNPSPPTQLKPRDGWRETEWESVPPGARIPAGREVRARIDPPPCIFLLSWAMHL